MKDLDHHEEQPYHRNPNECYSYEQIEMIAKYLLGRTRHRPRIGIVCGSGMGGLADVLEQREEFKYEDIPDFPVSTVPGHHGRLVFGKLKGVETVCMQGRFHAYEGYSLWKCAMPIRVMKLIGVKAVIITNAAGGLNPNYKVGDIMLIKDHINFQGFAGDSPLRGYNDERWGPRFPNMNDAYNGRIRKLATKVVQSLNLEDHVHEGTYVMLGGPSFETVAELSALKLLGADAVGMSTVHECVVARHCGLKVFAMSLITNKCVVEYDSDRVANHEEVIETADKRQIEMQAIVSELVNAMALENEMI